MFGTSGLKKTGFNLMILHFYIRRKLDIVFFVWMRTGFYPPDSNEYEKLYLCNNIECTNCFYYPMFTCLLGKQTYLS